MQLYALPPDRIDEAWPLIGPFAKRMEARFRDEWTEKVIRESAEARTLQLWLVWDEDKREPRGAVGTRIITKASGKRLLDLAWMAGDGRKDWMPLLSVIEDYARQEGCEAIGFTGRQGWAPDLPGYSMKKLAIYEKDLTEMRQRQAA